MTPTVLKRIAVVLVILLVAWLLLAVIRRSTTDSPDQLSFGTLDSSAVTEISYLSPQDTVRLERTAAGWTVNGQPAAPKVVTAFFRAEADSSMRSELVAQSAASHERLGVDSGRAKRLTVKAGQLTLADVWFGNRGPDFEGFYARRAGEEKVYLVRGTFADLTVQPLDDWRDRRILGIPADSVAALEIARGRRSYVLERGDSGWRVAGVGPADSSRVARFLERFVELKASGFPTAAQGDSADFSHPERRLSVTRLDGQSVAVLLLDSIGSTFLLRARDGGPVYRMDEKLVDQLTPPDSIWRRR